MEEVNPEKVEMRQIDSGWDIPSDTTQDETSFIEQQSDSTKQLFNSVRELNQLAKERNATELRRRIDEGLAERRNRDIPLDDFKDPFDDDLSGMMETEIGPDDYGLRPYDPEYRPTVTVSDARTQGIRRRAVHRDTEDFFGNILDLEPQCYDKEFVDWLDETGMLEIKRQFSEEITAEYKVKWLGGDFSTVGRTLTNDESDLLRADIRGQYDKWVKAELNKTMKKAGVITAVGLAIIALVTGLSVGLARTGADIVHQAKQWEKLHPSKKIKPGKVIPWTALEKASGKTIIFAGEYLVVIGVTGAWLLLRKKRR